MMVIPLASELMIVCSILEYLGIFATGDSLIKKVSGNVSRARVYFLYFLSSYRQGYGYENLISNLTEMISVVWYTFEYGDSESKIVK